MAWPTSTDYNEAIQNPQVCFADVGLRAGQADGLMGLPTPYSGNFADVYKLICPDGKNWAVKCFTREVQGLQGRYQAVSDHLRERSRPFMVEFQYLEQGVKVKGSWFPIVKMSWIEGFALNQFVADHAADASLLERLAEMWLKLAAQLREARMAHGDLQHGNVLLTPGSKANALALKLIDYDGMFVPALADTPSGELGHRNYQHPQRKNSDAYHPEMDRFANLAIYTALRCVGSGGGLWSKYGDPENLLFRQQDFAAPSGSAVLRDLWQLPNLEARALAGHLVLASAGPLTAVPLLSDIVDHGAVRALNKDEEARVAGMLGARPSGMNKARFDPRAQQQPAAKNATLPPLPSPLQPGGVQRRATLPIPPLPETTVLVQDVPLPPPLPSDPLPPPLPQMIAVSIPPLPAVPPPLPDQPPRMPELLPSPLPRAVVEAPIDLQPTRTTTSRRKSKLGPRRNRQRLAWAAVGIGAILVNCLLAWWFWSIRMKTIARELEQNRPRILVVDAIQLRGGDEVEARVSIDRRTNARLLVLKADWPAGVSCPPVTLWPGQESARFTLAADNTKIIPGQYRVNIELWDDKVKTDETTVLLTLLQRPMPRLINLEPLTLKIGETRAMDFAVDPQDNHDDLSLEISRCPTGVTYQMVPLVGDVLVVRVRFIVAPDAEPTTVDVKLRLLARGIPALPDEVVKLTLERSQ